MSYFLQQVWDLGLWAGEFDYNMHLFLFLGLQVIAAARAVSHDELVKIVEKSF